MARKSRQFKLHEPCAKLEFSPAKSVAASLACFLSAISSYKDTVRSVRILGIYYFRPASKSSTPYLASVIARCADSSVASED